MALSEDIQELTAAVRDLIVVLERADRGGDAGGAGGVPGVGGATGGRAGGPGGGPGAGAAGALAGAFGLRRVLGAGAIAGGVGLLGGGADESVRGGSFASGAYAAARSIAAAVPVLGAGFKQEQREEAFIKSSLQPFYDLAAAGVDPNGRALRQSIDIAQERFTRREEFDTRINSILRFDPGAGLPTGGVGEKIENVAADIYNELREIKRAIQSSFSGGGPS